MKKIYVAMMLVLCFLALPVAAQNKWVTGKVSDDAGAPMAGVTIVVKGSTRGTITDASGSYRISAKDAEVLEFSNIGYDTQEVKIGTKANIDVALAETSQQLENVVVTGYQTISRERATGSFDIIDKAQIDKPSGNIASRLIGAAAGLVGQQDEYGNPIFEIRGRTSLSDKATQPLLVVDGFAIEGGFETINPNDVESVTVLKDAAAASIWGAKSANGVIVITTKNARRDGGGKTTVTVDYSGFFKVSPKLDLDYTLNQASVNDIIDYEVNNYNKWDSSVFQSDHDELGYQGNMSSVYNLLNENRLGHLSDAQMKAQIDQFRGNNNYDQVRKYLLQNPIVHQENVAVNIATDRTQNMLSAMYQNNRSHYKGNANTKYMVNFRNKTNVFKWLDFNFNGSYTYTKNSVSGFSQGDDQISADGLPNLSPYEMLVDENGTPIRYSNYVSLNYVDRHVPKGKFPYEDWSYNPIDEMNSRELTSAKANARVQAGLTFKLWKGLTFDSRVQYEMVENQTHNYYNEDSYEVRYKVNTAASWNKETDEVKTNLPMGGFLDQKRTKMDVLTLRNQLNFNQTFADKHSIAFVAGVETIDRTYQTFGYPRTYGYNDETLTVGKFPNGIGGAGIYKLTNWQGNSTTFDYVNSFAYTTDRYFSAFGNASYTYDDRYTVSGSVRTDASNLITDDPAYRYAPFWSVGASWRISNEQFMQNVEWVDGLSLRATYGFNGNVDKSTTFKPLVNTSASQNVLTGEYTGSMSSHGNPTLRWEKTGTWDVGVDFNLFRGKLFGKFDVYSKRSTDLIANVSLPTIQGTGSMKLNNGEILNKGFEMEVGSTLRISKNVRWTGNLMLSYNKNEIKSLKTKPSAAYTLIAGTDGSNAGTSYAWMEGYDMNTLWCYQYGGIINSGTATSPNWQATVLGKDGARQTLGVWPTGDAMNLSYEMGTIVAPWNMAFTSAFKVYSFDISLIVTGKFGHKFLRTGFNYPSISGRSIPNAQYDEVKNSDPNEIFPLPLQDQETRLYFWSRFYPNMSYLAESAAHLRLQEVNVAYNLPQHVAHKIGMKSMQVYAQCNNPFSIYFNGYKEDPEFTKGSIRLQSSYTLGVKCKF